MISYLRLGPNNRDILSECGAPDEGSSSSEEHGSQGLLSNGLSCVNGIKGSSASLAKSESANQNEDGEMIANRLAPSDIIYNLSDVEKYLPKLPDEEWSVETVTRKRKERQDSGSSQGERKVIRSNSEERSECPPPSEDTIRRVSSHEDFEKNKKWMTPLHEQNRADSGSPLKSYSHKFIDEGLRQQKYSKNDTSPSRSRIHEYIVFSKRISPSRDPNQSASHSWDHERARSSERRSRTPAPRIRRGPPRRQVKQRSTKENHSEATSNYPPKEWIEEVKLASNDIKRSQSPATRSSPTVETPLIDLSMLHEHLGRNEPIPSMPSRWIGFPWDPEQCQNIPSTFDAEPLRDENVVSYDKKDISNIRDQRRTLPDKCPIGEKADEIIIGYSTMQPPNDRLHKVSKKLQVLKKRIAKCEIDFEMSHGYRPSQADKMNNESLCKLYTDMRRLKNEKKSIRGGSNESMSRPIAPDASGDSLKNKPMVEIMAEIQRRLEQKRITHDRPQKLEECTYIQLAEEKAAVQRALLWLEGAKGRPTDKVDRDTARPLYDRYRAVKRLVARYETAKANSSIGELATIMEHETMLFTNLDSPIDSPDTNDKPSQSDSGTSTTDLSDKRDPEDPTSSSAKSTGSDDTNVITDSFGNVCNENLHCLPLAELNKLLIETKNIKTSLRKNIKSFEAEFEIQNSRKLLKDERLNVLPSYAKYKEIKARLRLLNALVNKQKKAYG